ncbi:YqeG family HAD IIIA-type phosphatase [Bacillus massiliglaciei]|uniref:YqeG family HAD IIIA-type phosphatase n=1 Tax=Bacillus massiliglaciei TaxID=1816693 RepID=UPI000AFEE5D1|nr:YqeG family HAD IIIA-type phosphatase [Bacillus massiliglaciei]
MLKHFLPSEHVQSIFEIKAEDLKKRGIKGIITDLDNTLVAWDRPTATPELIKWFDNMRDHGILVTIVSNNNENRVRTFSDPLHIPFIHQARKPLTRAFKKARANMGTKLEETVVIGDQLLTDVLGGNRVGLHTILVVPVATTDEFRTKINRYFERRIMRFFKRKGMIEWEERN